MQVLILLAIGAVIVVPILRYVVWARRYKEIGQSFAKLTAAVDKLIDQQRAIEGKATAQDLLLENLAARLAQLSGQAVSKDAFQPAPAPIAASPSESGPLEMPVAASLREAAPLIEASAAPTVTPIADEFTASEGPELESQIEEIPPTPVAQHRTKRGGWQRIGQLGITAKLRDATRAALGGTTGEPVDWEALIGGKWLNLVGMLVLVVGVSLLTQQALIHFPPLGKIATGAVFGAVLLIGGMLTERQSAYRLIGRTLIGGGWALLYFDAYAAFNVEQARIITDPATALLPLAAVAAGMIGHSLRYRSQLVTGLAYGLGFLSIVLTPVTLYSLVASAALAASLVVVSRRTSWHYLAVAGVVATYANHWLWLQKAMSAAQPATVAATGGTSASAPDAGFWLATGILAFYWVLFAAVSVNRKIESPRDRITHLSIAFANTLGLLSLMFLQLSNEFGEHYLFTLTGPATIAYAAVAYLDRRFGQRHLFLFNASVGLGLYCLTLPIAASNYHWNYGWISPYLVLGSVVVLVLGRRLQEVILRYEAYLVSLLTFGLGNGINLAQPHASAITAVWFGVPALIIVFQAISDWLQRRPLEGQTSGLDAFAPLAFGIFATLLLANLLWIQLPHDLAGVSGVLLGVLVFEAGSLRKQLPLRLQGYLLETLGVGAIVTVNFGPAAASAATATRWLLVAPAVAVLFYQAWRLSASGGATSAAEHKFRLIPSIVATSLGVVLAYLDLNHAALTGVWTLGGIVLIEAGLYGKEPGVRLQGMALLALGFLAAVAVNIYGLDSRTTVTDLMVWSYTPISAAGLYYVFARSKFSNADFGSLSRRISEFSSAGATLVVALVLWKELPTLAVAVAWSLFGIVLFELSLTIRTPSLRLQAHLLLAAAVTRLFMANFLVPDAFGPLSLRVITGGPIVLALYYLWRRTTDLAAEKAEPTSATSSRLESAAPAIYSWAAVIVLVVLCRFEFGRAHAVAAWAPLVLACLLLGQKLKNREFRFQSYVLAIYAFARGWSTNIYLDGTWLNLPERISTTLPMVIALFAAALLSPRSAGGKDAPRGRGRILQGLDYADSHARTLFAALASGFVAVLLFYELSIDLVSIGWVIEGVALLVLGFSIADRSFRVIGLLLLMGTLLKVSFIDLAGVETIYRIVSFIALGLVLLLASLGYTKYRDTIRRYI